MTSTPVVLGLLIAALALVGLLVVALGVWGWNRLALAWRVLREGERAERAVRAAPPQTPATPAPARSEALGLLAVLQQEARLIDFLKEPLEGYGDAQVGAAVRDVHRDAAAVVERFFAIRPLRKESEGAGVEVPPGFDAASVRLTGRVTGSPPYRGTLRHPGWEATRAELPQWTGHPATARVVAPAEVEIR
jgi:Domain of unknown function (DUF2760)